MKLFTSRYSNKALATFEGVCVGTSVGYPQFPLPYKMTWRPGLGPERAWKDSTLAEYTPRYFAKLESLGIRAIMGELERISQEHDGADIVLLCYEDIRIPGEWCHRRMLAQYIEEHAGVVVEELHNPTPPKMPKPATQRSAWAQQSFDVEQEPELQQASMF